MIAIKTQKPKPETRRTCKECGEVFRPKGRQRTCDECLLHHKRIAARRYFWRKRRAGAPSAVQSKIANRKSKIRVCLGCRIPHPFRSTGPGHRLCAKAREAAGREGRFWHAPAARAFADGDPRGSTLPDTFGVDFGRRSE